MGISASNKAQSEFYRENDRTVDARPDEPTFSDMRRVEWEAYFKADPLAAAESILNAIFSEED